MSFPSGDSVFKCQPIHATLISFFDERLLNMSKTKTITLTMLSELLKNKAGEAKRRYIRNKMFFWIHKGVVIEHNSRKQRNQGLLTSKFYQNDPSPDDAEIRYSIVEDYKPNNDTEEDQEDELDTWQEEEHESISHEFLYFRDSNNEGVQSLEKDVLKILNNNGPKKIDKLFYLIDTLSSKTQFIMAWSKNDIQELLDGMVKSGKIRYENYVYYAVKN